MNRSGNWHRGCELSSPISFRTSAFCIFAYFFFFFFNFNLLFTSVNHFITGLDSWLRSKADKIQFFFFADSKDTKKVLQSMVAKLRSHPTSQCRTDRQRNFLEEMDWTLRQYTTHPSHIKEAFCKWSAIHKLTDCQLSMVQWNNERI